MAPDIRLKGIQAKLLQLDYAIGSADGVLGDKTEKALHTVLDKALMARKLAQPGATPIVQAKYRRLIPATALDRVDMRRLHWHWTGGGYTASETDLDAYHFVVEGDCDVMIGTHRIRDNVNVSGKSPDDYAAHTKNANSGAIALSFAAMGRAKERVTNGPFPIKEDQFYAGIHASAQLIEFYRIPVTDKTTLSHAEVQANLGIAQNQKWDITVLEFAPTLKTAKAVGDFMRAEVRKLL